MEKDKKVKESFIEKTKAQIIGALDENGNGKFDLEDIIIKGARTPGINIKRSEFLRKELKLYYPEDVVEKAIATNPFKAGCKLEVIDKIADSVIAFERNCVSAIAAALGAPAGVAMVATIPADIMQYYGYLLRCAQKLLYLYGFDELDLSKDGGQINDGTLNILLSAFGAMAGVNGANLLIKKLAALLANGVAIKVVNGHFGRAAWYVLMKKILTWFTIRLNKEILAGAVKKALPFIAIPINGGITYFSFKPYCVRLKKELQNTALTNPNFNCDDLDEKLDDIIDAEEVTEFTEEELKSDDVSDDEAKECE